MNHSLGTMIEEGSADACPALQHSTTPRHMHACDRPSEHCQSDPRRSVSPLFSSLKRLSLSAPCRLAVAASLSLIGFPARASAETILSPTVPTTTDADIVVTAQRRSEALSSVPVAVTAISGNLLLKQEITQPTALSSIVPNLQVNDSTGGAEPNFTLRGVGLGNDYSSNQASPVGVYTDDAYMAFRSTHGSQLFDLDRIEVLRGPQGTLFGRNTTGGAISFITHKPGLSGTNGYLDFGYGDFNDVHTEGAVEITPIDGVFGIRAAVSYERHDGYFNNIFPGGKDPGNENNLRGRLSLRFHPSPILDINLRLFAARAREYNPAIIPVGSNPDGSNPITGYKRGDIGFYDVDSDNVHRNGTNTRGAALTTKILLSDSVSLQSLTSFDTARSLFGQDVDGSPIKLAESIFNGRYKEINQELRLTYEAGPLKAQGGMFFGRDRINVHNEYDILGFLKDLGVPADPTLMNGGATINQRFTQIRISKAVFGQADLEFLPRLTLTLGARYTIDIARYENGTAIIGDYDGNPLLQTVGTPGHPLNQRGENRALTGRVALNYEFESGLLLYASYNRGYRAGTFNGVGYLDPSQISFVPAERVNSYEAGAKGRFFGGALSVALAGFYYDYSHQQIQDEVGPVAFLRSAGASTLKGVELETSLRLSSVASLSGNLAYTSSRYDSLVLQGIDLSGNRLPLTPRVTANGRFDYTIPHVFGGKLVLSPSVTFTSSEFFTPYNDALGNAPLHQGAFLLADGVIEWTKGDWSARLWGKNLTQAHHFNYEQNLTGFGFYYFNQAAPRTFGAAVRHSF